MRRRLLGGAVAGAALLAAPAPAADRAVEASGTDFAPRTVTVRTGETVRWRSLDGSHNVKFPGVAAMPATPESTDEFNAAGIQRTFTQPGTYRYFCVAHADGPGDADGMTGTVVVEGEATAPASFTATPVRRTFCVTRCRKPGVRIRITTEAAATFTGIVRRRGGKRIGGVTYETTGGTSVLRFSRVGGRRLASGRYTLKLTSDGVSRTVAFRVR